MRRKEVVGLLANYPLQPNMVAVLHNLGRMLRDSHRLQLVMGDEPIPKTLKGLFETVHVKPPALDPHKLGFALKASHEYLRSHNPDSIMNVTQPYPLGAAVALVGRWFGIRTILRITGNYLEEKYLSKNALGYAYRHIYHNKILNGIYRKADLVLPIGENIRHDLLSNGFTSEQITIQPQPFDYGKFSPPSRSKKESKHVLGLKKNRQTVLFVGRVSWGKGADRLVQIARTVSDRSNKYQFCIVGEGEYKKRFDRLKNDIAVAVGSVTRENIQKYYAAADLFIYPTRKDALPNVILEAIAAEVPIAASPVAEIPRYVTHTYTDNRDFVKHILKSEWEKEKVPEWFKWGNQKENYRDILTA